MKRMLSTLSVIGLLVISPVALAQVADLDNLSWKERKEKLEAMTPEEKTKYFEDRQKQWDAMPKAEKLKVIEERRAKRMKRMEDKWNGMSDDEKIAHVEKKMERWKNGKKGKHHDCHDHDKDGGDTSTPKAD